jgi:CheY-like chemotaxis protein
MALWCVVKNFFECQDDNVMKPASKNILIVEDTENVADLMKEMLKSFGYEVEVRLAVTEALATYEPGKFDLVITDYTMPGMNGLSFAYLLRQQSPRQLILLITGSAYSITDGVAKPLPVNATLQKPFSVSEFQDAITSIFDIEPTRA